jgi:hypothetical protein
MTHKEWAKKLAVIRCKITKAKTSLEKTIMPTERLMIKQRIKMLEEAEYNHKLNYFELIKE